MLWVVLAGASVATAVGVGFVGLWLWGKERPAGGGHVAFDVQPDESLSSISTRLAAADLVRGAAWFAWYKRAYAGNATLEQGEHWLARGSTPQELIQQLARRQSRSSLRVNIPEAWDSFQVAERLEQEGICSRSAFLDAVFDVELARRLVGQSSLEGYLYPASYDLRVNSVPERLVEKLVAQALSRFSKVAGTQGIRGLNLHQLVTLASVVQKEAADERELPLVASVFFNRLEDPKFRPQRMLQSDPTAGYGCKLPNDAPSCAQYDGRITAAMLRDSKNRYNTYRHPGLPPGPIGNPSIEALQSVVDAPRTEYYFFVAGPRGRHRFSKSLEQHRRAIVGKD